MTADMTEGKFTLSLDGASYPTWILQLSVSRWMQEQITRIAHIENRMFKLTGSPSFRSPAPSADRDFLIFELVEVKERMSEADKILYEINKTEARLAELRRMLEGTNS